ncbi:MAG: glycoside hydrolase family 3 C-terminal domain-containing protein [Fibrobacterales bacterium]
MKKLNRILIMLVALFMFIATQGCSEDPVNLDESSDAGSNSSEVADSDSDTVSSGDSAGDSAGGESSSESDIGDSSDKESTDSSIDTGGESSVDTGGESSVDTGGDSSSESSAESSSIFVSSSDYATEIAEWLGKLTIEQKVGQMIQGAWFNSPDINADLETYSLGSVLHASKAADGAGAGPDQDVDSWASTMEGLQDAARGTSTGIPLIIGIDAVHGNAFLPKSTVFPHNIGLGASRDADLVKRIGVATAEQVVAGGMNLTFGPVANMSQHEWWGRMYESFGESEEIVTSLTGAIIEGLQGSDLSAPSTISACAKHFLGDGVTNNGHERGDATISASDMEKHLAPYQAAIDRGVGCVMAGFTQVNGYRMHHNEELLTKLKDDMGFDGMVISDWKGWSIGYNSGDDGVDEKTPLTVADAVNAGVDMLMAADPHPDQVPYPVTAHHSQTYQELLDAVNGGDVSEARVDDAVTRILRLKYRLGLFEGTDAGHSYQSNIGSSEYKELAREAVQKTITVLKNEGDVLPLDKSQTFVVVGKHADHTGLTSGGWTRYWQGNDGSGEEFKADPYATNIWEKLDAGTTILDGVKEIAGSSNVTFDEAGDGSGSGDVAIVVIGEYPYAEWFGDEEPCIGGGDMWSDVCADSERAHADRMSFTSGMLDGQKDMVDAYVAKDMKVVVVVVTGRPIPSDDIIDDSDAFTVAWLPGSEGAGVADVLFGEAPATAKLPHAWISSLEGLPVTGSDAAAKFPFGHGLTYDAK